MEWVERYFDKEKECMSRDEMTALQSERLVKLNQIAIQQMKVLENESSRNLLK